MLYIPPETCRISACTWIHKLLWTLFAAVESHVIQRCVVSHTSWLLYDCLDSTEACSRTGVTPWAPITPGHSCTFQFLITSTAFKSGKYEAGFIYLDKYTTVLCILFVIIYNWEKHIKWELGWNNVQFNVHIITCRLFVNWENVWTF